MTIPRIVRNSCARPGVPPLASDAAKIPKQPPRGKSVIAVTVLAGTVAVDRMLQAGSPGRHDDSGDASREFSHFEVDSSAVRPATVPSRDRSGSHVRVDTHALASAAPGTVPEITLTDALDAMGFGWFHYRLILVAGCCFMADSTEVLLLSFLQEVLRDVWDLTAFQGRTPHARGGCRTASGIHRSCVVQCRSCHPWCLPGRCLAQLCGATCLTTWAAAPLSWPVLSSCLALESSAVWRRRLWSS